MTDSAGVVRWSADYKPFGEATIDLAVTTITNNLRFPGQYFDAETGLNYNYFRDYNPATGRYIEADRIGLRGGINLYRYARANPLFWIDTWGLAVSNPNNYPISPDVQQALENFNHWIGDNNNIVITGGNRPSTSDLGAGSNSTHVQGTAADIYVQGQSHDQTANQAVDSGLFGGIGWYQEGYHGPHGEGPHVHVDLRDGTATWGYDSDGNYYHHIPPTTRNCH